MIKKILPLLKTGTVKDNSISFIGHVVSALINAFFFALTARWLGPKSFGLLSLSFATAFIFKDVIDLAFDSAVMRFLPSSDQKTAPKILSYVFWVKTIYLLVIFCLTFLVAKPLGGLIFKESLNYIVPLTFGYMISQSILAFAIVIHQAKRKFVAASVFLTINPLIRLVLLIGFYYYQQLSLQSILLASIFSDLFVGIIGIASYSIGFLTTKTDNNLNKEINRFALPMIATSLSGTLTDKSNLYLTNYFVSTSSVGFLAAGARLFTPVLSLSGSFSGVFGSRYPTYNSLPEAKRYLRKTMVLVAGFAFLLMLSGLFAKPLIWLFYGPEYYSSIPVFRILSVGYAVFLFQVPINSYLLYYHSKSGVMAMLSSLQLVLTLVANLALIPIFGIIGAAMAFSSVVVINFILTSLFAWKYGREK